MFETLSSKFEEAFKKLRSRGKLSEADIDEALSVIRLALLEADVNVQVVKQFCANIKEKSLGKELQKSLTTSQLVIKFVNEELIVAMGDREPLNLRHAPPVVIMLVGLQGSGKTTSCGKLARHLRDDLKRRPLLVPADVYRPAAIEQLKKLGSDLGIEVFNSNKEQNPVDIASDALDYARKVGLDTVILDTAGRLQIDANLMNELAQIVETVEPHEVLLVVDAMTGQEAVNVAKGFDNVLDIDGIILTKLDGDARGGSALSMRHVIGKPIKFIGVGEKLEALEIFHPDRMASRILGMGDVLSLIERASKQVSLDDARQLQKKMKKDEFSLDDFYQQMQTIKKMGSISSLIAMVPGMGKVTQKIQDADAEEGMRQLEAIILSMTRAERQDYQIIDGSRRKRIARGSGTSVEDVNRLLKQFGEMRKVMKKMMKLSPKGLKGLGPLGSLIGAGAKMPQVGR